MMMMEQLKENILTELAGHFNDWLTEQLDQYLHDLQSILSPELMAEVVEVLSQVLADAVKGLAGNSRQLASKVA
jgi:Mor family transcriptional regulator